MPKPDLMKQARQLMQKKVTAEAGLAKTLSQLAAVHSVSPGGKPDVHVPSGAALALSVETRGVAIGLSLNKVPLDHPPVTKFTIALPPISQGDNFLVMELLGSGTWAYDIQLHVNVSVVNRAFDQDDGQGSAPSNPIIWHIAVP
jgi:hypothetical protein